MLTDAHIKALEAAVAATFLSMSGGTNDPQCEDMLLGVVRMQAETAIAAYNESLKEQKADADTWRDRYEAERQAHEATIAHYEKGNR